MPITGGLVFFQEARAWLVLGCTLATMIIYYQYIVQPQHHLINYALCPWWGESFHSLTLTFIISGLNMLGINVA